MCDPDGEIFVKPCTPSEINFYQSANEQYPEFAQLMPTYLGDLVLTPTDGNVGEAVAELVSENGFFQSSQVEIMSSIREHITMAPKKPQPADSVSWTPSQGKKIKTDKGVVLQNETFGFKRANILDVKLGTRLYADDAPDQKKQRFQKISKDTTHHNLGFRIAGMRVFRGSDDPEDLDDEEYMIYDKDYGRVSVNDDNVAAELQRFIFNQTAGIDPSLGKAVCACFARDLANVLDVMSRHESRMYSTSLLFVFEGDGHALAQAIQENNEIIEAVEGRSSCPPTTKRIDSGIGLDDEDLDEDAFSDIQASLPPIYSLKLIDFAHAAWTPGQGPDTNIMKGVKNLETIFKNMAE